MATLKHLLEGAKMNGKTIKTALSGITQESMTNGTMSELWYTLPDFIAGSDWVGEIVSMAETASDWVNEDEIFTEDKVQDLSHSLASAEVEDYYANINKRVQSLSLWAYSELDDEVAELFNGDVNPSLTDLNSHYLYCAMRGLAYQVLTYAYNKAEELEGADA
jgi:hypothetical protein